MYYRNFSPQSIGVTWCVSACKIERKCGHSQMELISDKWVFKGFEMDSGL